MGMSIHHGDCLDVMAGMEPESVDAIVTDPPYGLEFMGKEWDRLGGAGFHAPKDEGRTFTNASGHMYDNLTSLPRYGPARQSQEWHQRWAEAAYRVAKPSAYLLAFGGTRTVHRMTVALEDAGWIIRDMLVWAYASGFPKSKASLKPAWEPIVMARKPGPLRELAIDACRIGFASDDDREDNAGKVSKDPTGRAGLYGVPGVATHNPAGRWPANVILTDPIFDGGWEGVVGGGESASGGNINGRPVTGYSKGWADERWFDGYSDGGTYSRYFLIPKADRADREPVLGGLPTGGETPLGALGNKFCTLCGESWVAADGWPKCGHGREHTGRRPALNPKARANSHPTVKPTDLMRHLVRLVTPSGGTVLDPFLGSGTTGLACELEGFPWIGIEREEEYVRIAEARLNGTQKGLGLGA
jgi:DNA modification methylase